MSNNTLSDEQGISHPGGTGLIYTIATGQGPIRSISVTGQHRHLLVAVGRYSLHSGHLSGYYMSHLISDVEHLLAAVAPCSEHREHRSGYYCITFIIGYSPFIGS